MGRFAFSASRAMVISPLLAIALSALVALPTARADQDGQATSTVAAQAGVAATLPPVTMEEVSGVQLTVVFTATPSQDGTLTAKAEVEGRTPVYWLYAPSGGNVTLTSVALAAQGGGEQPAPLPSSVRVQVQDQAGVEIARCTPYVPPDGVVALPETCQAAGARVKLTPLGSSLGFDSRYFLQTGFRIDNDTFWNYFNRRGALRTFGYPVSRTFQLMGFTTQFFQRQIVQLGPDGAARTLNILDPGLMPFTAINGATFPAVGPAITAQAPVPGSPGYDTAVLGFVKAHAPDQFAGMNTSYYRTFANTVTIDEAFPEGGGDPNLLPGFDLEIWGVPTSNPAPDPHNDDFIYLRFQRGIMHYDGTTGLTQGLLMAGYLKAIITGQNLPPDLEAQARDSAFYRQYNPSKPGWVDRPEALPATDLTGAFEPE